MKRAADAAKRKGPGVARPEFAPYMPDPDPPVKPDETVLTA